MLQLYSVSDLDISNLLHDDKEVYVKEGHGGKAVWEWPIYHFFQHYYSGEKVEARKQFADWYIDQYKKYGNVKSSEGGMKGGSLDRIVQKKGLKSNEIYLAIQERVSQRFDLFDNIDLNGYNPNLIDPVKVYKINSNQYILFGGHHRVACLAVLNYKEVPGVILFNNELSYLWFRFQRKLNLLSIDGK